MNWQKHVLCIGAGYVGGPTMAVIAKHCPDYKITIVDINAERIAAWQSDQLPVYEPGLAEVIQEVRGRNLFFSTDIPAAIKEAEIIFISVNTPTKTFGEGAGRASNLQYIESTARDILKYAESDKIVVEKSTLPVRCAETIQRILSTNTGKLKFEVISNPEFLAEGSAIMDLTTPDRVLIGSLQTPEGLKARETIADIYRHWVPESKLKFSNLWSSELTKLAANAMLAQRISSINSLSALCEATDADITEVAQAIGMDKRLGSRFLQAGVGFGGSCFKKDILNLSYLAEYYGLTEVSNYWKQVVDINDYQQERFVRNIRHAMFNSLADKRLAILGFAFKADTGDTRETPALAIAKMLLEEHAQLAIFDPKAMENAKQDLHDAQGIHFASSAMEAAKGAHAILLLTDWQEFRELDYHTIYELMEKPAFIFDGRNLLDKHKLYETGFNVYPIGSPALSHLT